MPRLFIALKIPKDAREKIIALRNEAMPDFHKYKWEPVEKIHLTLKFIGEVKNELVEDITEAIRFLEDYESFNCKLTKFGFFYRYKNPAVLWMGLAVDKNIDNLVERLNEVLEKFSIKSEKRKFSAHLTIKRLKGNEEKDFVDCFERYKVPEVKFKAGEAVLMESDVSPSGSKYKEIKNFYLKYLEEK